MRSQYMWRNGVRVSAEDGARLLKTNEAAEVLGVSVSCVRGLIKAGLLRVRGTYSIYGGRGVKGWLVSEKDVLALIDSPEVERRRAAYARWKEARRRPKAEPPLPKAKVRPLVERRRIRPDSFQLEALRHALEGSDVLVVAPTGAGKTWVAEQLARCALERGCGFVYASPLKALSNQKYSGFAARFGADSVGIVTGDISLNPQAPVLVVTTEIYRNKCLASRADLDGVKWVAIDEFHLLDSDRGRAWEESVIFSPRHVTLVCLSATIPNYRDIAGWMEWVRERPVKVVVAEKRPVPLRWRWIIRGKVYTEKTAGKKVLALRRAKEEREKARWAARVRWRSWGDWDDWDEEDEWDEFDEWED